VTTVVALGGNALRTGAALIADAASLAAALAGRAGTRLAR
jgi:carbamate kinase